MESSPEPVTVIITRHVKDGSDAAFEETVRQFIPKSLAWPGHLGVHMLRPAPGEREYGAVLKFRSQEDWLAYQQSDLYKRFLADIEPYLERPPTTETLCGLESWFTPLGARTTRVPPRWKMALVTWLGVSATAYVIRAAINPWYPVWPGWLHYLFGNALVVIALTWGVMPVLSRVFRPWLQPQANAGER